MNIFRRAFTVALATVIAVFPAVAALATSSVTYNFNTEGDLDAYFNSYVQSGSIVQGSSGGIGNTADVDIESEEANGVFATKTGFSIGPVGSTYVFTAYMRSVGNSGYSGMGFTSLTPSAGNASGTPYRPTDALGISVHGGGFVFHDGGSDFTGNWNGSGLNAAITMVQSGSGNLLNDGSPDKWYKVVFTAVRDSNTTFDTEVKVWPVLSDGSLINSDASAIFQFNNRPATTIIAAPKITSYFNLSGDRVYDFDNFQVDISGGASIIEEGYAVVVTDSALNDYGTIAMEGDVADDGGQAITERGFAYGSSADPTISGDKVVVAGSDGTYSASTGVLADGTYHVRAYATNSNGTSYGADIEVTVDSSTTEVTGGGSGGGSGGGRSEELAATGLGFNLGLLTATSVGLIALGAVARRRARR